MARKTTPSANPEPHRDQLCDELVRLGLAPTDAEPLADELLRLARELPAAEYRALVEGVVLGQRIRRPAAEPASTLEGPPGPALGNILEDFASELKKLDEGLRVLTAYLVRLRDETRSAGDHTLH